MATATRKARKRAGIKFTKAPKVGTPLEERSYFTQPVAGPNSTRYESKTMARSTKKLNRIREAHGIAV